MFNRSSSIEVVCGSLRLLTPEEINRYDTVYKYVTTSPSIYKKGDKEIIVPVGFLTDGCTGGPDYGRSWLIHDWLYATHEFSSGRPCSREEADEIMDEILNHENHRSYAALVRLISGNNIFSVFSDAWDSSGERGPEFLLSEEDSVDAVKWKPIARPVGAIRRSKSMNAIYSVKSSEMPKLNVSAWKSEQPFISVDYNVLLITLLVSILLVQFFRYFL